MTPKLITRSQTNDGCWNTLIEQSQQSVLYAFTNYLDLVCQDWNALVWPQTGDYVLDARVGYNVTDMAKVSFIAKNVLNRQYTLRPGYFEPPRNYTVQLSYEF